MTTQAEEYPILSKIANLQDFTPFIPNVPRERRTSHLRPAFDKGAGIICGYTPAKGGGGSDGMMGVRAIARVGCRKCLREAQAMLDNPEYWAEQKKLRRELGDLSAQTRRLEYLDRRSQ